LKRALAIAQAHLVEIHWPGRCRNPSRRRGVEGAEDLHHLADRLRFLAVEPALSEMALQEIERSCRALWSARQEIRADIGSGLQPALQAQADVDLLDLAVLWERPAGV